MEEIVEKFIGFHFWLVFLFYTLIIYLFLVGIKRKRKLSYFLFLLVAVFCFLVGKEIYWRIRHYQEDKEFQEKLNELTHKKHLKEGVRYNVNCPVCRSRREDD